MEKYRERLLLKGFHIFANLEEGTTLTKLAKFSNVPTATCQKTIEKFCEEGLLVKVRNGREANIEFTRKGYKVRNNVMLLRSILYTI